LVRGRREDNNREDMVVRHPFLHEMIHPWAAMMTHEAGMLIEEVMALLCPEDLPCLPDLL
jgi:hypothetical protein